MAGIQFIDEAPTVEPRHGMFLATLTSGDETITLLLTRHALRAFGHRSRLADAEARETEEGFLPTPFTAAKRGLRNG